MLILTSFLSIGGGLVIKGGEGERNNIGGNWFAQYELSASISITHTNFDDNDNDNDGENRIDVDNSKNRPSTYSLKCVLRFPNFCHFWTRDDGNDGSNNDIQDNGNDGNNHIRVGYKAGN